MAERFTLTLPTRVDVVSMAKDAVVGAAESQGFGEADRFAIAVAVAEAVSNAVRHGNRLDPGKQVRIECLLNEATVEIAVSDAGVGFDPTTLPDPTAAENLESGSGRGVHLIRSYMDEVSICTPGNRLEMIKHRSDRSDRCCPACSGADDARTRTGGHRVETLRPSLSGG